MRVSFRWLIAYNLMSGLVTEYTSNSANGDPFSAPDSGRLNDFLEAVNGMG